MTAITRIALATFVGHFPLTSAKAGEPMPPLTEIRVASSIDGTKQPSLLWVPDSAASQPTPLLIWLHSWSFDYRQKDTLAYQEQAIKRGWMLLAPNFRGRNDRPEAGGSPLARADVLDALDYLQSRYKIDANRIYLAGGSGGGHMALLMAGYHPHRFSAVSAWVPITDLAQWHHFHAKPGGAARYAEGVVAVCGGLPGASSAVDCEYHARSPIFHLDHVGELPLDIAAGVNDGHNGTAVPIDHSLRAYNRIAEARGSQPVSDAEIQQLLTNRKLDHPRDSDRVVDSSYGCDILLRRHAGTARVTIFQGGHIAIPEACCHWLAQQQRATEKN